MSQTQAASTKRDRLKTAQLQESAAATAKLRDVLEVAGRPPRHVHQ